MATPKPPISVDTPWGEIEGPDIHSEHYAHDAFYLHGYSDKRQDQDQARAAGERTEPLPHRFQFVSVERSNGQPNNEKVSYYKGRGYKPLMYDELSSFGIDAAKSACVKGPDGTCRQGSQMVMVAPKEVAARDFRLRQEAIKRRLGSYKAMAEQAADDFNARHPNIEGTAFEFEERTDEKEFDWEKKMFKGK
jgi:hypothetical protein